MRKIYKILISKEAWITADSKADALEDAKIFVDYPEDWHFKFVVDKKKPAKKKK